MTEFDTAKKLLEVDQITLRVANKLIERYNQGVLHGLELAATQAESMKGRIRTPITTEVAQKIRALKKKVYRIDL
jgi:hypothetical protein